jgi:hypothetical protein
VGGREEERRRRQIRDSPSVSWQDRLQPLSLPLESLPSRLCDWSNREARASNSSCTFRFLSPTVSFSSIKSQLTGFWVPSFSVTSFSALGVMAVSNGKEGRKERAGRKRRKRRTDEKATQGIINSDRDYCEKKKNPPTVWPPHTNGDTALPLDLSSGLGSASVSWRNLSHIE